MKSAVRHLVRVLRRGSQRFGNWVNNYEPVGTGTMPSSLRICTADVCHSCGKSPGVTRANRIIYLLPYGNSPTGGNKVSYREIEIISDSGTPCFAFHPEKPGFSYGWFSHRVQTLPTGHFDPRTDFLVFSEMWAALATRFCVPARLRYAIFVQNGYLAHNSAGFGFEVLREAYRGADLILSISTDTTQVIKLLYPFVPDSKILRMFYSLPAVFAPGVKEKVITYMPRKLRAHSERLRLYLGNVLPEGWRIRAIDNMEERDVAELMSRSAIFLSFSDLEGYAIPPLEAAISGNIVVGYTGEGTKEYFFGPIFREVPNGNLLRFIAEVQVAIQDVDTNIASDRQFQEQLRSLADTHSVRNEVDHVMRFVNRVREIMSARRVTVAITPDGCSTSP